MPCLHDNGTAYVVFVIDFHVAPLKWVYHAWLLCSTSASDSWVCLNYFCIWNTSWYQAKNILRYVTSPVLLSLNALNLGNGFWNHPHWSIFAGLDLHPLDKWLYMVGSKYNIIMSLLKILILMLMNYVLFSSERLISQVEKLLLIAVKTPPLSRSLLCIVGRFQILRENLCVLVRCVSSIQHTSHQCIQLLGTSVVLFFSCLTHPLHIPLHYF